jgi:hypothetical protein
MRGKKMAQMDRAEEVRQERRRKPGSTTAIGIKLTTDESKMDRANYSYRWVKDHGGRMTQLHGDDWDPAPDGVIGSHGGSASVGSKIGGTDESGKPYSMVLMRKRKDWFQADQKEKQKPLDEMDRQIRRGQSRPEIEASDRDDFYTPGTNSIR